MLKLVGGHCVNVAIQNEKFDGNAQVLHKIMAHEARTFIYDHITAFSQNHWKHAKSRIIQIQFSSGIFCDGLLFPSVLLYMPSLSHLLGWWTCLPENNALITNINLRSNTWACQRPRIATKDINVEAGDAKPSGRGHLRTRRSCWGLMSCWASSIVGGREGIGASAGSWFGVGLQQDVQKYFLARDKTQQMIIIKQFKMGRWCMSHFWKKKISMNKKSRLFCHSQIAPSLPDSSKDLFHGVEIFRTKQHLCPCRDVRNGPSLNSYKFCRLPGSHFRSGVFLKTLGGGF